MTNNSSWNYLLLLLLTSGIFVTKIQAQDPVFSQFYSSPLSVNPALAGNGNSDWRIVGNQRAQWISSGIEPLTTTSLSFDGKLFKQKANENNYMGAGLFLLQDRGMSGAYKSTSVNMIVSSHVSLDENNTNGLSIGLGGNYSTTYIDFSQLTFSDQLTSSGFNRTLPTNEISLSNVKPYFSVFAGVTYNYSTENSDFDFGIAGYRFVKTNRSALNDPNQLDPARYNVHAGFQTYLSDRLVLNSNALYIFESNWHSYTAGLNLGHILDEQEYPTVFNTGLWLKDGTTIIPYLGLSYKNLQGGITYDVNIASSNSSLNSLKTFEFSLILRSPNKREHVIPCPWK